MQGAGNDFVLVEAAGIEREWPKLAKAICQRHFGVGADGLILMVPSKIAAIGMHIFNADGSEAEACGNGIRCLVSYAVNRGFINKEAGVVTIETIAGLRKARLFTGTGNETKIQVGMGKPEFDASKIPVAVVPGRGNLLDIKLITEYPISIGEMELKLCFAGMGNPHAVYFQQQSVAEFQLSHIGPAVEMNALFPNRVNFEVVRVINRKLMEMRVWERGVGETLACGSGACAVAVISQMLGYTDNPVAIKLPGGTLEVEWNGAGEVLLSGPAEIVFSGEWPD
ncbi:MAG: diaminopimelate epimerase [Chloroflexota bacterium]